MDIPPFGTEQFFARYEFTTPYLLCASDCNSLTVGELLALSGTSDASLGDVWLGYTESQGSEPYRQAIADRYETVTADEIVALGAPEEGIYTALRALLAPGDEVIVLTPAYDSLRHLVAHIAGSIRDWPIRATAAGWQLDLATLEQLITPRTRLVVVNFPHNPTGLLPARAEFDELIALVRRHGAWLFCDEMYRGLEFGQAPRMPSAVDLYERAIVLSGLSKTYGLPGLRAGWLALHDAPLRDAIVNWKHYTTICAPAPVEFLAQAALRVAGQLAARNRGLVAKNVTLADKFFARHPETFVWRQPQAGSVALVEMAVPSTTAYCETLAATAGILLLPGPYLGADDRYVRLGLGRRDFAANLDRYEAHLAQYPPAGATR
jgi:aspartate/methionine/tyrosine aminotransferase